MLVIFIVIICILLLLCNLDSNVFDLDMCIMLTLKKIHLIAVIALKIPRLASIFKTELLVSISLPTNTAFYSIVITIPVSWYTVAGL